MTEMAKTIINFESWKRDERTYIHPELGKTGSGWYDRGHLKLNSRCVSLTGWYGLKFRAVCEIGSTLTVTVHCIDTTNITDEKEVKYTYSTVIHSDNRELTVPFRHFNIPENDRGVLGFVCKISFSCPVENLCAVRGNKFYAVSESYSQSGCSESELIYNITVGNCTDRTQHIQILGIGRAVNELEWKYPETIAVEPYSEAELRICTKMSDLLPAGGFAKKTFLLCADGAEQELILYAVSELRHPYIIHDNDGWDEVRRNVKKYRWAGDKLSEMKKVSHSWTKPEPGKKNLFSCEDCEKALICTYVYMITGDTEFANKPLAFIRDIINTETGYLSTERVCEKELVQEGGMFRIIAVICDLLYYMLSPEEIAAVKKVFRRFIGIINERRASFDISNWILSMLSGQLACASFLQDRAEIDNIIFGNCGIFDNMGMGILSDGWWCECTTGYCMFSARLLMEQAVMLSAWGVDLAHANVSAEYGEVKNSVQKDGMCTDIYGGNCRSYRNIKMLLDSLIGIMDYRGVVIGINDSAEQRFSGESGFDLAYRLYGDLRYVTVIRNGGEEKRDIIFGVGELPKSSGSFNDKSEIFINGGVAMLRSQHGSPEERINIALKFGTHGGAHGHYDRTNLLAVMRYGRSLTNPETIWYLYRTFMYKFYMQTSITHNMVTVDLKQQKPEPSDVRLFYGGDNIQVMSIENTARWSYPPYGGWRVLSNETFEDRTWCEGRYVPIPANPPEYGALTDYLEPVTSLRTVVLTDEFIVIFDAITAEDEHVFDCMYHLREIKSVGGAELMYHKEQLTENPLSGGQFVTDCSFYKADEVVKITSDVEYTEEQIYAVPGASMWRSCYNEPGRLKTDLYYLGGGELITGTDASFNNVSKRLHYSVYVDGENVAEGKFGAWILGRETIDAKLTGKNELVIEILTETACVEADNELVAEKTIFLADAWVMTDRGLKIPLSQLNYRTENIDSGYGGDEVIISGKHFKDAVPANPDDISKKGRIILELNGMDAISFHAEIGGNYPLNGGKNHQRLLSMRKKGSHAEFISVIEVYKDNPRIKSVAATRNRVDVIMNDGITKTIVCDKSAERINVLYEAFADGKCTERESASE